MIKTFHNESQFHTNHSISFLDLISVKCRLLLKKENESKTSNKDKC